MAYRNYVISMATIGLMLSSCGSDDGKSNQNTPQQYPIIVVKPEDRSLSVKYSASLQGKQDVEIRPEISGLITKVFIQEGARVHKGQVLFEINRIPYEADLQKAQAAVATAEANLATAKLNLEGREELFKERVISDFELRTAQNTYKSCQAALLQAKADLKNAENNLSYTEVKSPVDGKAGMTSYRIGALVGPTMSEPLVTVSDNAQVYAYFSLSEKQARELTTKYKAIAHVLDSLPPISLELGDGIKYGAEGHIDAISGMVDKSTGTVSFRAMFPNPDGQLLSGGNANVVLSYDRPSSYVIPQGATYEIQDKIFTYRVIDGVAVSTPIEVFKINDGKEYIVVSGIAEGDTIVAAGAGMLKAGIKIIPADEGKKSQED